MRQFEVTDEAGIFEGHPWGLVRTDSDRLVCFFQEETHHGAPAYRRGVYVTSDDRGRTWSEKRPITKPSYQPEDPRRVVVQPERLHDGRIVAVTHEEYEDTSPGPRIRDVDTHLWVSDDGAESWRGPREAGIEGDSGYLVELSEAHGRRWLLVTIERFEASHEYEHRVESWLSEDEGETWSGPHEILTDRDHPEGETFGETSVVELSGGELVAFVRENANRGLDLFKAISRDGGETWAGPYRMPVPGPHKPMGGTLNSGRVMLTYRFVQGGDGPFWGAQNTFAALTDEQSCLATDRGDAQANILPLDHDAAVDSDGGYTDWVQFDDGEIYVVNYVVDGEARPERTSEPPGYDGDYAVYPRAHIRGYSFYEDEFQVTEVPRAVAEYNPKGEDAIRGWASRSGYDVSEE